MKNNSQNMVNSGRAAKGNSRQHEIRGQRCQRGRFSTNHFFNVRLYYRKNANYQGFCPDWAVKFCSILATSRRKFLPCWCRMKVIGQSLFERRRKSGEPLPKSGDGVYGFRGFGIAANFLQGLQRPSVVSCQSPGNDENNFSLTGDAGNQNAFRVRGHLCRFVFGQDSNLVAGLTNGTGKTLCSKMEQSLLKTG